MSKKPKDAKPAHPDLPDGSHAEANGTAESELSADPLLVSLAVLESENADLKDRLMRAAADMENLRKRTERELRETRQFAIASFARDMLVASDNLSRAIMVLPESERTKAKGTLKALIDGVEMTEREVVRLMEKNGVKRIEPKGERFDPNYHQAMFEVPDKTVPDGTVSEVVQAGYVIGSRILRPAMVAVARGGPKPAPGAKTETGETPPTPPEQTTAGEPAKPDPSPASPDSGSKVDRSA
jgi:molecular chaperone GrpE